MKKISRNIISSLMALVIAASTASAVSASALSTGQASSAPAAAAASVGDSQGQGFFQTMRDDYYRGAYGYNMCKLAGSDDQFVVVEYGTPDYPFSYEFYQVKDGLLYSVGQISSANAVAFAEHNSRYFKLYKTENGCTSIGIVSFDGSGVSVSYSAAQPVENFDGQYPNPPGNRIGFQPISCPDTF